jgi:hypothetical protein
MILVVPSITGDKRKGRIGGMSQRSLAWVLMDLIGLSWSLGIHLTRVHPQMSNLIHSLEPVSNIYSWPMTSKSYLCQKPRKPNQTKFTFPCCLTNQFIEYCWWIDCIENILLFLKIFCGHVLVKPDVCHLPDPLQEIVISFLQKFMTFNLSKYKRNHWAFSIFPDHFVGLFPQNGLSNFFIIKTVKNNKTVEWIMPAMDLPTTGIQWLLMTCGFVGQNVLG